MLVFAPEINKASLYFYKQDKSNKERGDISKQGIGKKWIMSYTGFSCYSQGISQLSQEQCTLLKFHQQDWGLPWEVAADMVNKGKILLVLYCRL